MQFHISRAEQKELLKAWLAISLAFAIVMGGLSSKLAAVFLISALTVGLGFLAHELAHKFVAQRYGCRAEFVADNSMLFIAVLTSLFGFVLAAPGAVMISGHVTAERNGKISLAGPLANFIIAGLFLFTGLLGLFPIVSSYGFTINAWLGLFNLIPFGNFDGIKILRWNKAAYIGMAAAGFGLAIYL